MEKTAVSPYEIIESDVKIEDRSWDDDSVQNLWARHFLISQKLFEYWQPYYSRGKQCFDYEKGNIFTAKQRAQYKKEDKYCVEPRLIEPRIYSLVGQIIRGRRSGSITTEGGSFDSPADSAKICEIASIVMKHMEQAFHEREIEKDLLHNSLVSCYPNWVWIEKGLPSKGEGVHVAKLLPWDSVAVAPFHFMKSEDVTTVAFRSYLKIAECKDIFKDMEEEIEDHVKNLKDKDFEALSSISEMNTAMSSSDRSRLFALASIGYANLSIPDGYFELNTRVFQLKSKEKVAINLENPDDFHIKPPDWDGKRWLDFIKMRRDRDGVEYAEDWRDVILLWSTVGTTSGLMLENKKHWFQENGRMPGEPYWPSMIDGDFCGHGEKMISNVMKAATAETEFLDEVRKGSGGVWVTRNGYITNIDSFHSEVNKSNGNIAVSGTWPGDLENVIRFVQRKPNTTTLDYANKVKMDIEDEGRINQSIQGTTQPQQSGTAKTIEIAQGMIAQAEYVENFNNWWERYQGLKCMLIPYAYSEFDIIEITDEKNGKPVRAEINAPVSGISGEVIGVANDLNAHRFKFKLQPVDDSPTAKQEEQRQFMVFLNAVPGPMSAIDPSGELLAYLMMSLPNALIRGAGERILQRAAQNRQTQEQQKQTQQLMEANERLQKLKNEAEKIKTGKVMFSITGEQLAQFPMLRELLDGIGYFQQQNTVPPEGGALPAQAPAQNQLQTQGVGG